MRLKGSEREALRQIDYCIKAMGCPPSNTGLADRCGFTSSNASLIRAKLKEKGLITFKTRFPRTTKITPAGRAVIMGMAGSQIDNTTPFISDQPCGPAGDPFSANGKNEVSSLKDSAICLLVDAHTAGATDFGNALGSILHLIS